MQILVYGFVDIWYMLDMFIQPTNYACVNTHIYIYIHIYTYKKLRKHIPSHKKCIDAHKYAYNQIYII